MLKVSIIVPIYNADNYLERCLNSLVNQKYQNLEIITIDDGSSDNSLSMCKAFSRIDDRVKVFTQSNKGVSVARNLGLENCTGDFISFVDSDDYIEGDMISSMIKEAVKHNADIVECGVELKDANNKIFMQSRLKNEIIYGNKNCVESYLKQKNTTNYNCNKIYRKKLFDSLRYPNYKYSEDYYINIHAFLKCNTKVTIPKIGYYYIHHGKNATSEAFNQNRKDTIDCGLSVLETINLKYEDLSIYAVIYLLTNIIIQINEIRNLGHKNLKFNEYLKYLKSLYFMLMKLWKYQVIQSDIKTRRKINFFVFYSSPNLHYNLKKIKFNR